MSYVLAAITQFTTQDEIKIRARGRSISMAVDVAEVVKNRFVQNLTNSVHIGTDKVTTQENKPLNVSTIEIILKK